MSGTSRAIGALWRQACARIERNDARELLQYVGHFAHADLIAHAERELPAEQAAQYAALVARRAAGEPLAYLLGSAFFAGREFAVSPAVLIPRGDTEVLVNEASRRARAWRAPRIVDLGTGSGIVAITLALRLPAAALSAVDLSPEALGVARANAQRHGADVRFLAGDWYGPLTGERFELIVANPPYVAAGDPHLARDGLPFEPQTALTDGVAGGDGMACIAAIVAGARDHLAPDGWLLIEHGYDQAVKVRESMAAAGLCEVASWRDESAIERVSGGRLPSFA